MSTSEWSTSVTRVTIFGLASPEFVTSKLHLWQLMTGDLPADRHQQPKTGIFQDSGSVKGGNLTLKIEGNRIDILYFASPSDPLSATFSEDFSVTLSRFREFVGKALNNFHDFSINRIALGGTFWHPVNTVVDGNALLIEKLNLSLKSPSFLDFSYQINYPYAFNTLDVEHIINRISMWSSSTISFQPILQNNFGFAVPAIEKQYIQVEIDVNNKPTVNMLAVNEYKSMIEEYFTQLIDIIRRGPDENVESHFSERN